MNPLSALPLPLFGDRHRVLPEDRFLSIVSLPQADTLAVTEIDRRDNLHRSTLIRDESPGGSAT
jgi:hypothetical protein